MNISENGKNLIKSYEGLYLQAYRCPSNVLTIGWGHTAGVYEGQVITEAEAERIFTIDMAIYEKPVKAYNVNQNQYDALTSFCYNAGAGALEDVMTSGNVTGTMSMYIHGDKGVVLPGLVIRRKEEVDLYNTPVSSPTPLSKVKYLVVVGNDVDRRAGEYLADYLQCPMIDSTIPFDYSVIERPIGVGGTPVGWSGYIKTVIEGSNRYTTAQNVLNFIKGGCK
ncbi:lysozyme [Clostridium gasigenes]|uniref:lysozyme n=1 Tax=Clostridium gasigenes TaxID=94869 RepID=UPI001C0C1628|nr:lysozyme [Clostridium gasigenes]MBU3109842.1 lysozyme [Clostridium gasigenes]